MPLFYISFVKKGEGFLGAIVAEGSTFEKAYANINYRHLNPGGEVMAVPFERGDPKMPKFPMYKLLSRDDLEKLGGFTRHGDMPKSARKAIETRVVSICQDCNEGRCTIHHA